MKVRTQYDEIANLRLGKQIIVQGQVEQRGLNGSTDSLRRLVAPTGRFRPEDKGKDVTILKAVLSGNLKTVRIATVVNATTVITDPQLLTEIGPLQWEVRGFPPATDGNARIEVRSGDVSLLRAGWALTDGKSEFVVKGRRNFQIPRKVKTALTEKGDRDGSVDSLGRFVASSAKFAPHDVGKKIAINRSSVRDNNGWSEIVYYKNATTVATSLLAIQGADANGHVRYFLKGAVTGVRVYHFKPGPSTAANIAVSGKDILITLATSAGGVVTSTAAQVVALINGKPSAVALVSAEASGTGAGLAVETSGYASVVGYGLSTDAGPLDWAVLPYPVLILDGGAVPAGIVDQDGIDLQIMSSTATEAVVRSTTARWSAGDVGKILTTSAGAFPRNNGTFRVKTFVNPNEVALTVTAALTAESNLAWELRTATYHADDLRRVQAAAPSIVTHLTRDFGIETDTLENEDRQRSYVERCNSWFDLKGTEKGYEILGTMSGISVDARQLFRVTKTVFDGLPTAYTYIIPEKGPGKSGVSGTLSLVGSYLYFTSTEASFDITDVGRNLRLTDTAVTANNKIYTIDQLVSTTQVRFAFGETASTLPMTFSALPARWEVCRLYSDVPPKRPRYDEINSDLLSTWVAANLPGKTFKVDKYCWEPDFAAYVNVTVVSSVLLPSGRYAITVSGPANVIVAVGRWFLKYSDGTQIFVETVPTASGLNWQFEVATLIAPTAGVSATLEYDCPILFDCTYCGSYRTLCVVETDVGVFETAREEENLEERIRRRLQQVLPIHSEVVILYRTRMTTGLKLSSSVEV